MAAQRYPIGMQTFSNLIEGDYTYVDKTAFIKPLVEHGSFIFLSRPRRFGKSLLVSTLKAFFEGRRDLFKGLAIDSMDMDWTPSPVFHLDFTSENYSLPDGLERRLNRLLEQIEEKYGREYHDLSIAERFNRLIEAAYRKTGQRVVILVDEYDKPLLDIEEFPEIFEKNQRILKSLYGNLKGMDQYIRFAFITGVARFSKVSIFSDLNNLRDISLTDRFANICGWTEEELCSYFHPGIETLALKSKESFNTTLNELRYFYDGYLFAPEGSRLYNPFSVLCALADEAIRPYWFATGTPTFLVKRIKRMGIYPPDINGQQCTIEDLSAVGLHDSDPIPLMFQTGYLTIASYDPEMELYDLRFPNREVEIGFYRHLLPLYAPPTAQRSGPFNLIEFKKDLHAGNPQRFMERLETLFKDIPYDDHSESTYRAITYLIAVLCSAFAMAEHHGYKGRSDIEVLTWRYIYIFEFKYNKTLTEAVEQLQSRDYAGRYSLESRPVFLIAANFISDKENRQLQFDIQEIKNK